jgi:hypothetical protein
MAVHEGQHSAQATVKMAVGSSLLAVERLSATIRHVCVTSKQLHRRAAERGMKDALLGVVRWRGSSKFKTVAGKWASACSLWRAGGRLCSGVDAGDAAEEETGERSFRLHLIRRLRPCTHRGGDLHKHRVYFFVSRTVSFRHYHHMPRVVLIPCSLQTLWRSTIVQVDQRILESCATGPVARGTFARPMERSSSTVRQPCFDMPNF